MNKFETNFAFDVRYTAKYLMIKVIQLTFLLILLLTFRDYNFVCIICQLF